MLDILADTAVAIVLALMAWQFWIYAGELVATGERTYRPENPGGTVLVCLRRHPVDCDSLCNASSSCSTSAMCLARPNRTKAGGALMRQVDDEPS